MNRGERERLPWRRDSISAVSAQIGGHTVHLHTAAYADGRLGEIFVRMKRGDPLMHGLLNTLAVTASIGLQYGVPAEELVDAWTFQNFEPNGAVVGNDRIKFCSSLVDFIGRELGIRFLGRDDLAHKKTG